MRIFMRDACDDARIVNDSSVKAFLRICELGEIYIKQCHLPVITFVNTVYFQFETNIYSVPL